MTTPATHMRIHDVGGLRLWCGHAADSGDGTGDGDRTPAGLKAERAHRFMRGLIGMNVTLPIMRPQRGTAYLTAWLDHWIITGDPPGRAVWGLHYEQQTPQSTIPGNTAFYMPTHSVIQGYIHTLNLNKLAIEGSTADSYDPMTETNPNAFFSNHDISVQNSLYWYLSDDGQPEQMFPTKITMGVVKDGDPNNGRKFHYFNEYKYTDGWADIGGTGAIGNSFEVYGYSTDLSSSLHLQSPDGLRGYVYYGQYRPKPGITEADFFVDPNAADHRWWYQR